MLVIPGWQATAYLDAVRSFYLGGQLGDPSALSHEQMLPCGADAVVDAAAITSPTYLYWGGADTSVPVNVMARWQAAIPIVKATIYPGEGHTVQYRHCDQILFDMAGYRDYTVVCRNGQTRLVPNDRADVIVGKGATIGLCAWAAAARPIGWDLAREHDRGTDTSGGVVGAGVGVRLALRERDRSAAREPANVAFRSGGDRCSTLCSDWEQNVEIALDSRRRSTFWS